MDLLNILLIIGAGVRRLVAFDCLLGLRCHNPGLFEVGNFNWSVPNKMRGRFIMTVGRGKARGEGKRGTMAEKGERGQILGGQGIFLRKKQRKTRKTKYLTFRPGGLNQRFEEAMTCSGLE